MKENAKRPARAAMTIHGFLTDVADFGRLYDYLGFYDEVVKCKVPGHNDEVNFKNFETQPTLDKVLGDYDALREKYEEVDVIGFSMGGALATLLAAERDVHRAVLVSPANKYFNFKSLFSLLNFYYTNYRDCYNEAKGAFSDRWRYASEETKPYRENSIMSVKIALKRLLPNISFHTYGVFKELMDKCNEALGKAVKIDNETLLMWGELDELVPRATIDNAKKYFTNLEVNVYKDVGHAMLLTNRDQMLINDIVKFLARD